MKDENPFIEFVEKNRILLIDVSLLKFFNLMEPNPEYIEAVRKGLVKRKDDQ